MAKGFYMKNLGLIVLVSGIIFPNICFSQLVPNGSFEDGTLPSSYTPGETLDPLVAMPNWSILGSPLFFQYAPLGGPAIAITTAFPAGNGSNSVFLQAGFGGATTPVVLAQSLLIPLGVKTITFQAREPYDPNLYPPGYFLMLLVSVAGQPVTPVQLSTDISGFTLFAVDVTPYSGTTVALNFSVDPLGNPARGGAYQVDDVRFSTNPVPEPSMLELLVFGSAAFGFQCFYQKRNNRFQI